MRVQRGRSQVRRWVAWVLGVGVAVEAAWSVVEQVSDRMHYFQTTSV